MRAELDLCHEQLWERGIFILNPLIGVRVAEAELAGPEVKVPPGMGS